MASSTAPAPDVKDERVIRTRKRLERIGRFFAEQRHLIAVRDGVVGALPLILVGSIFLLLSQAATKVPTLADFSTVLLVPYRMLGGLIAIYVTFACANSLAKSYALDQLACGLLAVAAYFIAAFVPLTTPPGPPSLNLARLGAGGIFTGIFLAIFTVELTRQFVKRKWTIGLPETAPEAIVKSFRALLPSLAVVTIVFVITHLLAFDIIQAVQTVAKPLLSATGSLPAALGVASADSALWVLGVHATAALATLRPFWESMLLQNADAVIAGQAPPHIATLPFYQWFVWQGGSGATLALAFHLLRAKSAQLKTVGKAGIVPALFNVNEPIVFGVPIVLNPTLAIPFFIVPLISVGVSYAALSFDLVTRPYIEVLWVLPAPVGAFLSTGNDWRAVVLQLFNLAIAVLIYAPFVRRYDLRLLAQQSAVTQAALPLSPPAQTP